MNQIKNDYSYEITDRFGTVEVNPLNEKDFVIDYEKDTDGKYFYTKQFGGKITFNGVIFHRLRTIEQSAYICSDLDLRVYRHCEAGSVLIFDGFFRLSEGAWDLDKCQVELSPSKSTPDKCLTKNKNKKIDFLAEISNRITVKTQTPAGAIETKTCHSTGGTPKPEDYWCGTGTPEDGNWVLVSYTNSGNPNINRYTVNNSWAREVVTTDCNFVPPADWIEIEDNCTTNNTKKYAKKVILYDFVVTSDYDPDNPGYYLFTRTAKILGYDGQSASIDNGFLLSDMLSVIMAKLCDDGFSVVSDFFQINPENPSGVNYVTGLPTQTNNIVFFQKTDVKRPNSFGNASKAEWTFDKLIEALNIIFNVYYAIDGDVFRLEHISYFSRNQGLNLTLPKYSKYVQGLKKYTYKIENIPSNEIWQYKETRQEWVGNIDYTSPCAMGSDNVEKKYNLDEITGDVQLCIENPTSESNIVEDKGFVIMATTKLNNEYYIITESEDGGGSPILNNTLGFHKLVKKYHFHDRPLKTGVFNGIDATFISTKPFKSGEKITVPLWCEDNFDPNDTIETYLGTGIVDKATFNLASKTLDLDLVYNVFDNLAPNEPPTIPDVVFETPKNTPLVFPIGAVDGDGTIQSIEIVFQPTNGVVEILSLTEARYTPNLDFVGLDLFSLKAFDNWGEASNVGNFAVDVKP